jgi:molybdopterin-guanine dinucleotide biosynthesis protein A
MNSYIQQCTGVILAGGENRRMPVRKAFIHVRGRKIIDRNLRILKGLFEEVLIVTNEPEHYTYTGTKLLGDIYDIRGPMTGLFTALFHAGNKWVFVTACDMPFISGPLVRYMASRRYGYDAVVPSLKGRPEPLFAFYSTRILLSIERSLLAGDRSLNVFLHNHKKRVQYIPSKEIAGYDRSARSFINLNTPGDIDLYLQRNDINLFKKAAERRGTCSVLEHQN